MFPSAIISFWYWECSVIWGIEIGCSHFYPKLTSSFPKPRPLSSISVVGKHNLSSCYYHPWRKWRMLLKLYVLLYFLTLNGDLIQMFNFNLSCLQIILLEIYGKTLSVYPCSHMSPSPTMRLEKRSFHRSHGITIFGILI